jgi:ribosomal protein S28E/S33
MADDSEDRIDLRGDGRVILYKRSGLKDPVWQVRIRVPNSTGYKRITTRTSDQREAERFALNY